MTPKWLPTNLGAEPKKLVVLGGLVVVFVAVYWMNREPNTAAAPTPRPAPAPIQAIPTPVSPRPSQSAPILQRRASSSNNGRSAMDDFRPSVKLPEGVDVIQIDPSLRLDL